MGQLVFLELNQGAKVEFVSGKVDSVLGELSEVKQLVVSDTAARAEWEARITNKMDKLLSDGANSREQELGVLELAERVKTLEMDRELNLRLQAEVLRLREENEKFRAQGKTTPHSTSLIQPRTLIRTEISNSHRLSTKSPTGTTSMDPLILADSSCTILASTSSLASILLAPATTN